MNLPDPRDQADTDAPSGALLSALTSEHYTLQSARSSTIVEANGRSMLFLSAVSGATVALALVAQLDGLGKSFTVFALSILPALLAVGFTSYARLADLAVHDAYYARAIGRIRAFYFTLEPKARHYWLLPAGDNRHAVMQQTGQKHTRWHHLGHTATSVAAVNAVIAGVLVGLVAKLTSTLNLPGLAALAVAVTLGMLTGFFIDQERRWRRSDEAITILFLPDGSPAMTVHVPTHTGPAPAPLAEPIMTPLAAGRATPSAATEPRS
jgi:hypothetical protein